MTCGRKLADGQYWHFCGETDMGQTLPALCIECGGQFKLADEQTKHQLNPKLDDIVLTNYNVHDHLKDLTVEELQALTAKDRLPFAVTVINLDGSLNVGIIIRTACLLGAERVFVFGRRKYDVRSCVGSHNYIPIERVNGFVENRLVNPEEGEINPTEFIDAVMTKHDYYPIFVETGGQDLTEFLDECAKLGGPVLHYDGIYKPCLVFGSESKGIPESLIKACGYDDVLPPIVSIPQLGVIRSFNVSAAASIVMWEMYKALRNS